MKYRKLTSSGDYSFGTGNQEFYTDIAAVAQAIGTRLDLWQNTFWRDLQDGIPFVQHILGKSASDEHLQTVDAIIQNRIKGTTGVNSIISFNRTYDRNTRKYSINIPTNTIYGTITVQDNL